MSVMVVGLLCSTADVPDASRLPAGNTATLIPRLAADDGLPGVCCSWAPGCDPDLATTCCPVGVALTQRHC